MTVLLQLKHFVVLETVRFNTSAIPVKSRPLPSSCALCIYVHRSQLLMPSAGTVTRKQRPNETRGPSTLVAIEVNNSAISAASVISSPSLASQQCTATKHIGHAQPPTTTPDRKTPNPCRTRLLLRHIALLLSGPNQYGLGNRRCYGSPCAALSSSIN